VREKILLGIGLQILLLVLLFLFFRPEDTDAPTDPGAIRPGFTDSTAYCASVQTIDAPDERWAGSAVPSSLVSAVEKRLGQAATINQILWRCLDGRVYWCLAFGTNWCQHGDTSLVPTQQLDKFCSSHSDSDDVGRVVAGRATVDRWGCRSGEPTVLERRFSVDVQGFMNASWYALD